MQIHLEVGPKMNHVFSVNQENLDCSKLARKILTEQMNFLRKEDDVDAWARSTGFTVRHIVVRDYSNPGAPVHVTRDNLEQYLGLGQTLYARFEKPSDHRITLLGHPLI